MPSFFDFDECFYYISDPAKRRGDIPQRHKSIQFAQENVKEAAQIWYRVVFFGIGMVVAKHNFTFSKTIHTISKKG